MMLDWIPRVWWVFLVYCLFFLITGKLLGPLGEFAIDYIVDNTVTMLKFLNVITFCAYVEMSLFLANT